MDWTWLRDPWACLELVTRLVGWGLAVAAAEWLSARRVYADDAMLGWSLVRQRSRMPGDGPVARLLGVMLAARGWGILQWVALIAGLELLLCPAHPALRPAALGLGTLIGCLTHLRQHMVGSNGADAVRLCILGALTLREAVPDSALAAHAVLWFIAGQGALIYCVSGILKCRTSEWRKGTAVGLVLRQELMGHAGIARWFIRHPGANRAVTWSVLVLELLFPLALAGGPPVTAGFLAGTLLMHLGNAHFMGLAVFLWAFLTAYPAVLFTSAQLQRWLER